MMTHSKARMRISISAFKLLQWKIDVDMFLFTATAWKNIFGWTLQLHQSKKFNAMWVGTYNSNNNSI